MTAARCSGADARTRAAAVAEARAWRGTPYCHQASAKGAGADCLGLIRGVWRARYGAEPERPPAYSPHWGETDGAETLLAAAARRLLPIGRADAGAGDLAFFRMREGGPAKHVGLISSLSLSPGRIIHAYSGHGVVETHVGPAWARRLAAVYRLPGSITDKET